LLRRLFAALVSVCKYISPASSAKSRYKPQQLLHLSNLYDYSSGIMTTINMVKFFFLKKTMPSNPKDVHALMTLAYQTAREKDLYPKAILIR
jgi:hypothetical protein